MSATKIWINKSYYYGLDVSGVPCLFHKQCNTYDMNCVTDDGKCVKCNTIVRKDTLQRFNFIDQAISDNPCPYDIDENQNQ